LVIDNGKIPVPLEDDDNFGYINFGAGSDYLVTYYENFVEAKGFTMCGYNQMIGSVGGTKCLDLNDDLY
jgi:hypothetical protein